MQNNALKPFSILVIEDEDYSRKQLVDILNFDYKYVYSANNSEKALKIYQDEKPDIMIVDINLPKINGLEFIKHIRINDIDTKVIILTAHSDVEYLMQATSLKLIDYLIKPISRKALKKSLDKAISEIKNFSISSNKIITLRNNFTWNSSNKSLYFKNEQIQLSIMEKKLLNLFIHNQNILLEFDTIIIDLWDDYNNDKMNALKTLIKKLRRKLPENSIENIYKQGYIFKI